MKLSIKRSLSLNDVVICFRLVTCRSMTHWQSSQLSLLRGTASLSKTSSSTLHSTPCWLPAPQVRHPATCLINSFNYNPRPMQSIPHIQATHQIDHSIQSTTHIQLTANIQLTTPSNRPPHLINHSI